MYQIPPEPKQTTDIQANHYFHYTWTWKTHSAKKQTMLNCWEPHLLQHTADDGEDHCDHDNYSGHYWDAQWESDGEIGWIIRQYQANQAPLPFVETLSRRVTELSDELSYAWAPASRSTTNNQFPGKRVSVRARRQEESSSRRGAGEPIQITIFSLSSLALMLTS